MSEKPEALSDAHEPVRNDSWRAGRRNGVKWAVEYLHNQAKSMNDPHATQVLNAAAFHLGTDAKSSITDASLADAQRASFVRGEMGNIEADRAETRLTRPCTPASHVDANDDLFDDQIADAIWEAASNGDGRITAVGLRRELTLLGLQIVSKAYHDSIAVEHDELAALRSRDATRELLLKEAQANCDGLEEERDTQEALKDAARIERDSAQSELVALRSALARAAAMFSR
jgi:hypothetical protein